ncbi:MAG: LacI family transcriptional regulator [Clostridiales bacterium]|nr:LacI family transcriptional regulator [Clostridiales bacterium]
MNLKTIAKMAGVSTVTVSNVMNGKYNRASKETIERVLKIIEENDYRPSATARSLTMKQSRIIGVVVAHLGESEAFSASPYDSQMLAYLERYVRGQGYYMLLRCVQQSSEAVPIFSTWNVDGALLLGMYAEDALELQKKLDIPAVFIDTYAGDVPIANVGVDDYKGGYLAAKHLLDKGHRRIAFVAPSPESPGVVQERYRGFCDALGEQGLEVRPEHCFKVETLYESGVEAGKQIAASPIGFTAAAAMADVVALGVMEGLRLSGLRVPEDVSVTGFDNLPECQYSHPKLTSVSQRLEEKAQCAGEYLFSMLRDGAAITGDKKVDVELVERESVKALE